MWAQTAQDRDHWLGQATTKHHHVEREGDRGSIPFLTNNPQEAPEFQEPRQRSARWTVILITHGPMPSPRGRADGPTGSSDAADFAPKRYTARPPSAFRPRWLIQR